MSTPLSTDPVILPWPEMSKKAERDGVDIMDYVNSMHAHVLNQRDQLARQNKRISELREALRPFAEAAAMGERRYALLKAAGEGVMDLCDGFIDMAKRRLSVKNFRDALTALDGVTK
jgi:hypothetical protein